MLAGQRLGITQVYDGIWLRVDGSAACLIAWPRKSEWPPSFGRRPAYACVVGQESLLVSLPREAIDVGRFAVFQAKLRDLESRTGLNFGSLRTPTFWSGRARKARFERAAAVVEIRTLADIVRN